MVIIYKCVVSFILSIFAFVTFFSYSRAESIDKVCFLLCVRARPQ